MTNATSCCTHRWTQEIIGVPAPRHGAARWASVAVVPEQHGYSLAQLKQNSHRSISSEPQPRPTTWPGRWGQSPAQAKVQTSDPRELVGPPSLGLWGHPTLRAPRLGAGHCSPSGFLQDHEGPCTPTLLPSLNKGQG